MGLLFTNFQESSDKFFSIDDFKAFLGTLNYRVCDICTTLKKTSDHHCRICGKCVEDMDHHCIWINLCISKKNLRYFFNFLMNLTIISGIAFYYIMKGFLLIWNEEQKLRIFFIFSLSLSFLIFISSLQYMVVTMLFFNQKYSKRSITDRTLRSFT